MRKIIFILVSSGVVLLILALFMTFQSLQQPVTPPNNIPIPTKIPQSNTSIPGRRINFNIEKADELVDKAENRQTLSDTGVSAKAKLISSIQGSGPVFSSPNVKISYIKSPDLFQAEILSADDIIAKQEAISWMLSQGFTQDDLCKLPFSFFLGTVSSQKYLNSSEVFNPLPDGC